MKNYRGNIEQTPPMYSAIKLNGKKLYEYARNGQTVELAPRKITINTLEILEYNNKTNELVLYIDCSKGTYIRSLANDIGNDIGTFGHLNKLVRVKSGNFELEKAVKLEDLKSVKDVEENLINPVACLNYPVYEINDKEYKFVINGNPIKTKQKDGIVIIVSQGNIISVGNSENEILKPLKVFI